MTRKHGYCSCDTCHHCGAPVFRSKRAVYNVDPAKGLLHAQSCTNPPPITDSETVEEVRRSNRL